MDVHDLSPYTKLNITGLMNRFVLLLYRQLLRGCREFVNEYGTGNSIATPAEFTPRKGHLDPQLPDSPIIRAVDYQRVTRRANLFH
ncbi:hypothetical protein JR316_0007500 [Psilocybe cubensis]|uniref:Uncharacterized protein n=4 Tax=Psilocybe cubensis TaxID=181762 RepID=A0ACB8GM25_PSICU|nr:hypothetical protein JR316_0011722 [Psilocybe cubensis]XP_047743815.1 hypothetical protein JR316_0011761 [Psilocybe cubensis]XP_047744067.1 hypothetical protein JR316_0012017 [Psilocybe cubensis]XP_047748523.1 hypothetical protein JR316_0007500 [Psilocybe cubensis]KAH9476151.1 hypothetical protein JR316_0011722 [Psilocybe cubensis]KAH9476190.1 hypothetical protein JR316_0011761 [Psilocybe cubensis]KAH9476442.1 hypothetical protein JR316_0012017 [Psilocybe cubensis]KAH9480898.1 hypothetica